MSQPTLLSVAHAVRQGVAQPGTRRDLELRVYAIQVAANGPGRQEEAFRDLTIRQLRALGAVQLGLSGGEPLLRDDLETIVAEAHRLGYYINLITSGIGLTAARMGDA